MNQVSLADLIVIVDQAPRKQLDGAIQTNPEAPFFRGYGSDCWRTQQVGSIAGPQTNVSRDRVHEPSNKPVLLKSLFDLFPLSLPSLQNLFPRPSHSHHRPLAQNDSLPSASFNI